MTHPSLAQFAAAADVPSVLLDDPQVRKAEAAFEHGLRLAGTCGLSYEEMAVVSIWAATCRPNAVIMHAVTGSDQAAKVMAAHAVVLNEMSAVVRASFAFAADNAGLVLTRYGMSRFCIVCSSTHAIDGRIDRLLTEEPEKSVLLILPSFGRGSARPHIDSAIDLTWKFQRRITLWINTL